MTKEDQIDTTKNNKKAEPEKDKKKTGKEDPLKDDKG